MAALIIALLPCVGLDSMHAASPCNPSEHFWTFDEHKAKLAERKDFEHFLSSTSRVW